MGATSAHGPGCGPPVEHLHGQEGDAGAADVPTGLLYQPGLWRPVDGSLLQVPDPMGQQGVVEPRAADIASADLTAEGHQRHGFTPPPPVHAPAGAGWSWDGPPPWPAVAGAPPPRHRRRAWPPRAWSACRSTPPGALCVADARRRHARAPGERARW